MKNWPRMRWVYIGVGVVLLLSMVGATLYAYWDIRKLGAGPVWHIPSRIFSNETRIAVGTNVDHIGLTARLKRLRYRSVKKVRVPGEYNRTGDGLTIFLHAFDYPGMSVKAQKVKLVLENKVVKEITGFNPDKTLAVVSIEPEGVAEIFDQGYEDRTVVTLKECPEVLINAIIATEDRRFFKNWGIDLRSIFRAGVVNLKSGRIVEGGSTITQQLVKNLYLSSERTMARKLRETWMAMVMAVMFSKQDILEMYINEIYLGQWGNAGIYGFGRAARIYFDKDIKDLTLPEAALLAGIIRAPNLSSPYKHPDEARDRRNTVLERMLSEGYIDAKACKKASRAPLGVAPYVPRTRHAPYFVDYLLASLDESYPVDELSRGGYRIFTTLDMNMQLAAEEKLAQGVRSLSGAGDGLQGALVMLDPQTGEIRAMVGGESYARSQFNRAVQMRRQIGSLVKPFVYYAAVKNGSVLSRLLDDNPLTLPTLDGKEWTPSNFDNQSHGQVMLADALINSYNIATVRLGMELGLSAVAGEIRRVQPGIKIKEQPSLLLGTLEASPLTMSALYAPFANMGKRVVPIGLKAVVKDTSVLRRDTPAAAVQVMSPEAVYLVDTCLLDVVRFGTAKSAGAYGMPGGVCGKTGTTNDMRDAWFVGFTPDIVTVVWVGNDANRPVNLSGATGALPIVSRVMGATVHPRPLRAPGDIVFCDIDPQNGKIASELIEKRTLAYIKGTEPTEVSDRVPEGGSGFGEDVKESADKVLGWFKSLF